jgi:predicted Zn-dependent protease with MMP-like domain
MKEMYSLRTKPRANTPVTDLMSIHSIKDIAFDAFDILPENFQSDAMHVHIVVENFADAETLKSLRMDEKYELLGLYRGTPIPVKSVFSGIERADVILLYRCPLIRYSIDNNESIETLIKHVVLHELGYHFGYSRYGIDWYKSNPYHGVEAGTILD